MLCPHCDHEISDDTSDLLDGICPQCEGSLAQAANLWEDADDYDREYEEDDFDTDLEEDLKDELGGSKKDDFLDGEDIDIDDEDLEGDDEDSEEVV